MSALRASCLVALMYLCLLFAAVGAANNSVEQQFSRLANVEHETRNRSTRERALLIGAAYDELVFIEQKSDKLEKFDPIDLEFLFRAAKKVFFYSSNPKYVQHMMMDVNELDKRGVASDKHYLSLRRALIQARMFQEVRELDADHHLLQAEILPTMVESPKLTQSMPTEWVVSSVRQELLRRPANLDASIQIVVISHPLCHFSRDAVSYIQSDPLLSKLFIGYAKWLAPQSGELKLDIFQQWNRMNPNALMTMAYKQEEWPMFDEWGTPTFYFLKNGIVEAKVVGWPKEGRREELLVALKKIGLLSSSANP